MGTLINQFCDAVREWSRKTASSEREVTLFVMSYVGSPDNPYETDFSIEQVKDRLETLVNKVRLSEQFLIVALIQAIQQVLESLLENYGKAIRTAREIKVKMEVEASEQERKSANFRGAQASLERASTPSLEDLKQRKVSLDTWLEVISPLLQSENLEREELKSNTEMLEGLEEFGI